MSDTINRLKSLDNNKLIDVVKNYRQYGYSEEIRSEALKILDERGIDEMTLKLTGNFDNTTYDEAARHFEDFKRNSRIAFILYGAFLTMTLLLVWFIPDFHGLGLIIAIIPVALLFTFLFFLIRSFLNQAQFYKTNGKEYGADGAIIYLILGMPFYIFMYFYFRNQMRNLMKTIK